VEQIMTPRTEVEAMELTNNLGEIVKFIRQSRHSRIPVYEGSLDQVVGFFYVKDLMRWLAGDGPRQTGKAFELRSILRPAYYVPETKTIRELLSELVDKKVHVAMVADEYGGTSGLVTLEDIVEEIFGEIQDEYEQAEDELPEIHVDAAERAADIDARAYIRDANDALRAIGVGLPEGEAYDTVGGLVVTTLGRIPTAGESLRVGEVTLTVTAAEPTRVERVRLEAGEGAGAPVPAAQQPANT
jgi:CBS domain containing-hemolysin-like protein